MTKDKEQVIAIAQICGDWNGETVEMNDVGIKHFATLVGNAKLEEAAKKCVASELIDLPSTIEIAAVRKCVKAIESLKEPTT